MDFLIFYEHASRELENILMVKEELNKRGYSVGISHFCLNGYGRNVLFAKPKVVVTPWLRSDDNIFRFTRFSNKPSKIVNLQWEQIYNKKNIESGLAETQGQAKKVNHVCWGRASKDRLIKVGISIKNLKVTGAIQLDFGRKEFEYYYKTREELSGEFKIDSSKKWILYISSFAYATYSPDDIERLEQKWNMSYSEMYEISKISRVKTLEWIKELLSNNSEIVFIYRPHPSEKIDDELLNYKEIYNDFFIIKDYSVKQWIKACDKINTWFSTSIAEIFYMGRECAIVRPYPLSEDIEVDIMKKAKFITNKDDFLKYNLLNNCNEKQFPVSKELMDYYYDYDDDIPSYVRVAEYLERVYSEKKYDTEYKFLREEKKIFKKIHKNEILVSLIVDFILKTNIKLSKIIPFKKRIFINIENKVLGSDKAVLEYEKLIYTKRRKVEK